MDRKQGFKMTSMNNSNGEKEGQPITAQMPVRWTQAYTIFR